MLHGRYDAAYAAAGILDITAVARDHVQVRVRDRLTGYLAHVDPQIVAIEMILGVDSALASATRSQIASSSDGFIAKKCVS